MGKAVEKTLGFDEDELGSAEGAASLGADGGPAGLSRVQYQGGEPEGFGEDDSWLDEELSDEELAALGEEDFDDEDLIGDAFDDTEDFSMDAPSITHEKPLTASKPALASIPDEIVEEAASPIAKGKGAVVTAASMAPEVYEDSEIGEYGEDDGDHRQVPRISIHAFCETPETTSLLENASIDRRLAKTHLTMHMGGLSKAVDHFQTTGTPNLIIIETVDGGAQLLAQLAELAEVCDPSTKVIIIGRINDIALYRELIRQGISEYVVRPRSPLQIIKSIATLYIDPSAPPIGRTIAFVGARGGVGSSTIAHNVAWCTAEEFLSDTVILDLDLPFGTASLDFEQDPTSGLIEALASPERLDDVLLDRLLQKHTERLSLFTAPNLLDRDYDIDDQAFETVIDVVRGAAPTIIVDVPHIWTSWSKRLLQTADEIVITATSDLASFRNTKNLVDIVSGARPNDSPPILVINQFDPKLSSVRPEQYVEHVGLKPTAVFNWEPQLFHTAATNAAPIVEVGAKSKAAATMRELSQHVLGRADPAGKRTKFDLMNLFKKR